MSLTRRRFLAISAAAALPHGARAETWSGTAFGADATLTIRAPRDLAKAAIAVTRAEIDRLESLFSLYRDSALTRLNASGQLDAPDPLFADLMSHADIAHRLTDGRFEPTVQRWWHALALNEETPATRATVGWARVRHGPTRVTLDAGQALTLNGIAQGYATDRVARTLRAQGLTDVLVNVGEYRALGGPFRIGLSDPAQGLLGALTLRDSAVATSSPGALALGPQAHILHPDFPVLWSTVTVSARTATLADALSTALCLAPRSLAQDIARHPDVQAIRLVDAGGDLVTLT